MSLGNIEQGTAGIKKQAKELIEQAYNRGFKAGREYSKDWEKDQADRLIEQGRNEAWEAAGKVIKMGEYSRKFEVFPECGDGEYPFDKVSASEAIERIHAYEEQKKQEEDKEIKVGDEVRVGEEGRNAFSAVVHLVGDRGDCIVYQCVSSNGLHYTCTSNDAIHKTGRHFPEIAEVLKKMKEASE